MVLTKTDRQQNEYLLAKNIKFLTDFVFISLYDLSSIVIKHINIKS